MSLLSQLGPRPRTQVRTASYPRTLALGAALTALTMGTAACMGAAPSPYAHAPAAPSASPPPSAAPAAPPATVATDPSPNPPASTDPPLGGSAPAGYESGR